MSDAFNRAWALLKTEDDRSRARSDWRANVRDQLESGDASRADIGLPQETHEESAPMTNPPPDILQALMDVMSGRTPQHMEPGGEGREPGAVQCPQCGKAHVPTGRDEQGQTTGESSIEHEGNITGICSDECWDKFLGVGE